MTTVELFGKVHPCALLIQEVRKSGILKWTEVEFEENAVGYMNACTEIMMLTEYPPLIDDSDYDKNHPTSDCYFGVWVCNNIQQLNKNIQKKRNNKSWLDNGNSLYIDDRYIYF